MFRVIFCLESMKRKQYVFDILSHLIHYKSQASLAGLNVQWDRNKTCVHYLPDFALSQSMPFLFLEFCVLSCASLTESVLLVPDAFVFADINAGGPLGAFPFILF